MKLVRGAWKILVGIKDALVLVAMLLFFGLLFTALAARPGAKPIKDGALVLDLDGQIVEQPQELSPFAALGTQMPVHEYRLRDLVRALDAAKTDDRVKVVVLDLDRFGGGYPATLDEVAQAIRRVRDAKKPVLAYATAYTDSAYRLAANASEIWESPIGGTVLMGPGGSQLYYKGLLDKLGVNAHIYRVGKYKSAVEPYFLTQASPEAKEELAALYKVIEDQWQQSVAAARPQAKVRDFLDNGPAIIAAANGDVAHANIQAGMVDKLGDRIAFGTRVAQLAGADDKKVPGAYQTIDYQTWLDAHPLSTDGDPIGVLTIAGDIVDGKAKAGSAGGDTIAKALTDRLAKGDLKALVVRVDSPGGSVTASERIREAIMAAKAKKLPIVVSMGSLAASGGYWVSTPGDVIFAEPTTITGSIGIFGVIPTFEGTLKKIGLSADGVKTTPLSGQPDIYGGITPEADSVFQTTINHGYAMFVARVAQSRKLTPERVNAIGQGRVWDGGTARQIGLVDRFGNLDDAVKEAAKRAGVTSYHADWLEKPPSQLDRIVAQLSQQDDEGSTATDAMSRLAAERRAQFAQAIGDALRLGTGSAIQARCLACEGLGGARPQAGDARLLDMVLAKLGW